MTPYPHPNPELSGEDRFEFSVAHSDINYRHLLVFDLVSRLLKRFLAVLCLGDKYC